MRSLKSDQSPHGRWPEYRACCRFTHHSSRCYQPTYAHNPDTYFPHTIYFSAIRVSTCTARVGFARRAACREASGPRKSREIFMISTIPNRRVQLPSQLQALASWSISYLYICHSQPNGQRSAPRCSIWRSAVPLRDLAMAWYLHMPYSGCPYFDYCAISLQPR